MSGMAKLADDIAYGIPGRTHLNAGYSRDENSPCYLSPDAQALRFVGHPAHLATMKALGNTCKLLVVHGVSDKSCPFEDAQEMVENMMATGLDVEPHFITEENADGKVFASTGHALGDRTQIVFALADRYLKPDSPEAAKRNGPSDFQLQDAKVRYATPHGAFFISYKAGLPVGAFIQDAP